MSYPSLSTDANRVLRRVSQEIAREFGLDYVGTEHILLAILRHQRGRAAQVLDGFGLTEEAVREAIEKIMRSDMEDTWVFGRLPGSPHYRNVMARAIDEATRLGAREVGTEHLLLALLREQGSTAQRVLEQFGVTLETCRKQICEQPSA